MRRVLVLAATVLVALVATAPAALAADDEADNDDLVVITGGAEVPEGEVRDAVFVVDGPVRVAGRVRHAVVVLNGDVEVSGTVGEDVTAFNGRVTVRSGAQVGDDVASVEPARIEPGATVAGDVRRVNVDRLWERWWGAVRLAVWFAVSVSAFVLGLVLVWLSPRAASTLVAVGRQAVAPAVGWGLAVFFGLPVAAVVAMVTLVGLPLGLGLLAALLPLYAVGYVTAGLVLGRLLVKEPAPALGAFAVGMGLLRAVALVPGVDVITGWAASVFGLGVIAVAVWRARGPRTRPVPASVAPTMPPRPVAQ